LPSASRWPQDRQDSAFRLIETDLKGTPSNWQRRRIETELRTRLLLDAA
jgi:hypothetical protein